MPEEDTINIKVQDENAPLSFAFAPIVFTEADIGNEYQYIVSEAGDLPGVTLDQDHIVYVRISDNYDGTLKIDSSTDGKSLTLVDTYEATGSVTLKGDIGLVGRKMREGDSWKAVLSAEADVPMPEKTEQLLSANHLMIAFILNLLPFIILLLTQEKNTYTPCLQKEIFLELTPLTLCILLYPSPIKEMANWM